MQYSPLCDTSLVAYIAYLSVVSTSKHGSSFVRPLRIAGGDGVDTGVGGRDDAGGDVVAVFGGLLAQARCGARELDVGGAVTGVRDYVDNVVGVGAWSGSEPVVGLANRDDGDCVGGLDPGVRVERGGCSAGAASRSTSARLVSDEVKAEGVRGKNWERNRAKKRVKRERKLARQGAVPEWRRKATPVAEDVGCPPSLSGTVCTVDTRTADELEAVNTLARRRVAENKVAERMAQLRLNSLNDEKKTLALKKLEAVRLDQRVNAAKAKSEESFKKCSDSLKSLGSIGSAGELYMRHELFEKEKTDKKNEYLTKQLELAMTVIPGHVRQQIADLEPPVMPSKYEVFGDCPSDYDEDQREAYYADLAADEPIF